VVGVSMGVRPVRVDEHGRIFELSGERFVMPGLEPADVLAGLADAQAGRIRSLEAIREDRAGGWGVTGVSDTASPARAVRLRSLPLGAPLRCRSDR
jgi:hypothetical protein